MEWDIKDGVINNIKIEYMYHAYCKSIWDLRNKKDPNIESTKIGK